MSRTTSPSISPTTQPQLPQDKIALRAYEKWVKRGRQHGSHEQDWLEAEAELRTEQARSYFGQTVSSGTSSTANPSARR